MEEKKIKDTLGMKKAIKKEVTIPRGTELARLKTAINSFKYDIGVAPDFEYLYSMKAIDSARLINILSNMLFRRGLLPEELRKDFDYLLRQLKV